MCDHFANFAYVFPQLIAPVFGVLMFSFLCGALFGLLKALKGISLHLSGVESIQVPFREKPS